MKLTCRHAGYEFEVDFGSGSEFVNGESGGSGFNFGKASEGIEAAVEKLAEGAARAVAGGRCGEGGRFRGTSGSLFRVSDFTRLGSGCGMDEEGGRWGCIDCGRRIGFVGERRGCFGVGLSGEVDGTGEVDCKQDATSSRAGQRKVYVGHVWDGDKGNVTRVDDVESVVSDVSSGEGIIATEHVSNEKEAVVGESLGGKEGYQFGQIRRGKNFEKNKAKRERRRLGKKECGVVPEWRRKDHRTGYFDGCDVDRVKLLKESRMDALIAKNEREVLEHKRATAKATGKDSGLGLETKWKAENKLAELRAIREVEVLGALDVRDEVRKKRAQVTAATEKNLVSIEVAHGSLVKSGNASEDDSSRINTVFSVGSGSISPNSSISEAEVRKLQKDFEDLKVSAAKEKKKEMKS